MAMVEVEALPTTTIEVPRCRSSVGTSRTALIGPVGRLGWIAWIIVAGITLLNLGTAW